MHEVIINLKNNLTTRRAVICSVFPLDPTGGQQSSTRYIGKENVKFSMVPEIISYMFYISKADCYHMVCNQVISPLVFQVEWSCWGKNRHLEK